MVLEQSEYDSAYFGDIEESGGLRHDAGYSDYLKQQEKTTFKSQDPTKPFNERAENLKKLLETLGLEDAQITELGGGTGTLAEAMLEDGFDWTVVDVANWCFRHKIIPDENFIEQDALSYLEAQGNNSIGAIVSARFLVCLSDVDAQIMIDEMRMKTQRQVHFVDEETSSTFYNVKTLEQWRDAFNWGPPNRITLVSVETERVITF